MKMGTVKNTIVKGFKTFDKTHNKASDAAAIALGLQLLNFCANGSPSDPIKPPILTGYLRGSGSVFYNNRFLTATPPVKGKGEPLKAFSVNTPKGQRIVTVIYNTAYALRMHESFWNPGKESQKDGNTGRKWLERHVKADAPDLIYLYGEIYKKEAGT